MSEEFNYLPTRITTRITETAERIFIATVYGFEPTTGDEQIQEIAEAALRFSGIFHAEVDKFEAPYRDQIAKNLAERFERENQMLQRIAKES